MMRHELDCHLSLPKEAATLPQNQRRVQNKILMASTVATRNMSTGHAASIFPGDKVRLDGLVSSSQYNGLRGIVVDVQQPKEESKPLRYGVHFYYNGERKLLSIQMHNLVLLQRLGSNIDDDDDDDKHKAVESTETTNSSNANDNIELINSILTKWRNQGCFLRFDPTNSSSASSTGSSSNNNNRWHKNLVRVPLDDVMDHMDDWVVDWDITLTTNEIILVRDYPTHRGTLLKLHLQTEWRYYYWDDDETNDQGESITICMERYGVGGWYQKEGRTVAAFVFLSADKSFSKCWLLGMKNLDGQLTDRNLEESPSTYHLSITTSLGKSITALLSESVFEVQKCEEKGFRPPPANGHTILAVFSPDEDVGFIYSVGLHPHKREFFALNVNRGDAMDIYMLMNFLATRFVTDKQTATSQRNKMFIIHAIDDEDFDRATKDEYLCQMDPEAKTFMLLPLGVNLTAIHTKNGVPLIATYAGMPSADPTSIDGV